MILQRLPSVAMAFFLVQATHLHAQGVHSDIRFDYQDNRITLHLNAAADALIGVGDFGLDGLFRQYDSNPGFASEIDDGLGVNPSDTIVYNVLDNLLFWNGDAFTDPDPLTQIWIENNGAPDTIVDGSSGVQLGGFNPRANVIGQAEPSGYFHDHVDFFLEPNIAPDPPPLPEIGAYGLMLSLSTDAAGIADSDPFLIVHNFGLDPDSFDEALEQFAQLLAPGQPGDYDLNGLVDGADFLIWQRQFGESVDPPGSGADGNGNGLVDAPDYLVWIDHFGASDSAPVNGALGVPEPSTSTIVVVLVCGTLVAMHRNRRCNSYPPRQLTDSQHEEAPMV